MENNGSGSNIATKSRWKAPDKFFPVVVDNFFENPEALVEFGKSSHKKIVGRQPGLRSKNLWEIDQALHNAIIKKALSCYYDLDYVSISWQASVMEFHEIPRYTKGKKDIANKGWIHQDADIFGNDEIAGIIYLTPDIDPDSGTSLWTLKPNAIIKNLDAEDEGDPPGQGEEWAKKYLAQISKFEEKLRFQNIFNRMIMYDSMEWHGANSYWHEDGKDPRLTLAFFIGGIETNSEFPMDRVKNEKFDSIIAEII